MITLYIPLLGLAVIYAAILLASYWSGMWARPNVEAIHSELREIDARIEHTNDVKTLERMLLRINVIMIHYWQPGVKQCPKLNQKIHNCHDRISARIHVRRG